MSSDQLLETVRGKLTQISQLAAQFTQVEAELRDSFEQLQSLHSQEISSLHEVCRQNGISIPHKPRVSSSWVGNQSGSRTSNNTQGIRNHTFDQSIGSSNGNNNNNGNNNGRGGYIPPPPIASGNSNDNNHGMNGSLSPRNQFGSPRNNNNQFGHGRSKSTQHPVNTFGRKPFGNTGNIIPTAQNINVDNNNNNQSISSASRAYSTTGGKNNNNNENDSKNGDKSGVPLPPGPPSGPPPPYKPAGFGVTPRSVRKKKQTVLPSNGLDEKDFYKKYWIEAGKIGEGAFARVRRITRKEDKKVFALKMVKKKGKSENDIAAFQKEILVLQKCNHKNIVQLLDWCDTRKRIYMVVEFCDGGDVFERVLQLKKFNESTASHVVSQVASGLEHCHSVGIVHRDLKPDNLMYLTKDEKSEIKIIDFGLAQICFENEMCTTPCGTAHYAAPEVLGNQSYNYSADMWSLGVIIYTLLCGFPPFFDSNNNMKNLYSMIKKGKWSFPSPFWDDISLNAKDLIKKLLKKDPKERLTAKQVLEHEWVKNKTNKNEKEFESDYINQMKKWQSTRHATEMSLNNNTNSNNPNNNNTNNNNNDSTDNVDLYASKDNGNNGKKYM